MATTYKLIDKTILTATQTSIVFSSIPQTGYTDLLVQVSARSNEADNAAALRCYFNKDTGNISVRELRAINTSRASYTVSYAQTGYVAADQSTANTFGFATIYIPNYTSGNYKSSTAEIIEPSNTASETYAVLSARLWSVTDAVNSITLKTASNDWLSGSSFYLYGIKNS